MAVLDLLRCFVPIKEQEVEPVLYSFTALFSILTSYFLLLPLREDAGISLGTSTLPLLFACSLAVTLLVTPAVTAYLNSKGHAAGRDAALRHFYQIMAAILLGFFVLYNFSVAEAWMDRLSLAHPHPHLPHGSSMQWAHPLDTVLQHRQQQQLQHDLQQQQQQQQQHGRQQLQQHGRQQLQQQQQRQHQQQRLLASDTPLQPAGMVSSLQSSATHSWLQQQHQQLQQQQQRQQQQQKQQQHQTDNGQHLHRQWPQHKMHMRVLLQAEDGANDEQPIASQSSSSEVPESGPPGSRSSQGGDSGSSSSSSSNSNSGSSSGVGSSPKSTTFNGRSGDAALSRSQRRLRAAFYVWVNVMNLVGISSLWAKCADAFNPDAGARLFGFISAGATLGQLAGSLVAMVASWVAGSMLTRSLQAAGGGFGSSAGSSSSSSSSSSGGSGVSPGSSSSNAAGAIRAAPPALSLLLLAAALQLVAAQLVTRIRPVRAVGPAGPAFPKATDSSSGVGGDRATTPLLVRRSASGSSTAVVTSAGECAGIGGATSTPSVLPSIAQGQAVHEGGTAVTDSSALQGSCAVPHTSSTSAVQLQQPNSHQHTAQQHASQAGSVGPQVAGSSSTSVGSGSSGSEKATKAASFQLHKVLTGFQLIWQSDYLLLVCSNLLLTYVVGSLMYFQRALVVSAAAAVHGPAFRTAFFAALNIWSAAAILLMQLFATSSLLRWLGMSLALGLAPAICLAALLGIACCPLPWMVAVSEVARKVFGYAVLRPAREVLFTVVSREEKYSAKLVIDTVIQRLGDALAAAVFQVLDVQYSLGQAGVGAAGCIMCIVWLATALALGRKHKQLAMHGAALKT